MPTKQELQKQRDERYYASLRGFADKKRRCQDDNGRKPTQPTPVEDLPRLPMPGE